MILRKCYGVAILLVISLGHNTILTGQDTLSSPLMYDKAMKEIALVANVRPVEVHWPTKAGYEIRRCAIELKLEMLSVVNLPKSAILRLSLFDGEDYFIKLNRVVVDVNNTLSISGKIEGTKYGYFYLSTKNGIVLAMLEAIEKSKKYLITYDKSANLHYITEVDPLRMNLWECRTPLIPER